MRGIAGLKEEDELGGTATTKSTAGLALEKVEPGANDVEGI